MKCKIKEISSPEIPGRIIAVSDIHGYVHYLDGVLKKAGYSDQDALVIIGDMIEKGPESLKTVRYIMGLCEENPRVYVTMGNVEYHRLSRFYDNSPEGAAAFLRMLKETKEVWERGLFLDMLDELGIALEQIREEDMDGVRQQIRERYAGELDFLWNLPTVIAVGNYLFVHAGVPTDCLSELAETDAFACMKIRDFLNSENIFDKTVVVGHTPVCLYRDDIDCMNPIFDYRKHIIAIDGGCALKYGEQMNALIIPGAEAAMREVSYIAYDDYPVLIAPEAQEPREKTVVMRYFDCEVQRLEDLGDMVNLRHLSTGKIFSAPKKYLFFRGDRVYCNDYTDACLAIEKGDRLSVIFETTDGCIVKKDGILGWYKGRRNCMEGERAVSKIKVILWDIDGTLLNFEEAEKYAIRKCFSVFGLGECSDAMLHTYSAINREYWKRLERGEMTKPEILVGRFRDFFAKYDLDLSVAADFNAEYQIRLGDTVCFYENGLETVQACRGKVLQYAVTNGTKRAQDRKLENSGLIGLLDGVFISEVVGVEKPMKGFFDRVFDVIGTYEGTEVLIVGDSLTSDIQGGNNAGILTCWFNPEKKEKPADLRIDYEISDLGQVLEIL